ncbi:MAG: adenylate/guanylate cyclase domain-containing protein [Chitinophagaceae bacterium]|nr:adenylate/guanylate cyclase domain-containing protein [Rubrivivax sp.]
MMPMDTPAAPMLDPSRLTMTEIIRLQNELQHELTRRFERPLLLLFSDIVGSTPYFNRFGDAAGRQLQQLHFDLVGQCVAAANGRIVDTSGDGAFCVFPSAADAVAGAISFQQRLGQANVSRSREHQLQVRVGMHWGRVLTDGKDVSGDAVNLCARVASSADSGEIRLTRRVFQELDRVRRQTCRPLGSVALKGVPTPTDVLALEWRDPALFPRRLRIEEIGQEITLPQQDIVTFGRLPEHDGARANDVVLSHPSAELTRQISRWHFELRRVADGLRLRAQSESVTEVDGTLVGKGEDVPVRSGSRIRVAGALTLRLLEPDRVHDEMDLDSTMISSRLAPLLTDEQGP